MDSTFMAFAGTVAGRYFLDKEIGRGGMGIVYLAKEVGLDRAVAIKLLPPERAAQQTLREGFLREARLAAKLSHPNIIPIHSVEENGDFVFYVMAYVDGETLAHRVRTRGPLTSSEGARVLREVAWALAHAHERGPVHRDVKPDNILLEQSTGRVLVADFGIAGAMSEVAENVAGTPEFMSPEQALGNSLDARSDLYSLGATAFYAFSGRFPFEGKTATEVLAKQITEAPPPMGSLGLTVPKKITALIDRCLAKDPAQRPETAQVLAEQLNVALELRKELPLALRAFVKRTARIDGPGAMLGTIAVGAIATGISALTDFQYGFAALGALTVGVPFTYMTWVSRRLLKLGFAHQDIEPAFKAEAERAREELAVEKRVTPGKLEGWLPPIVKSSWAVGAVTGPLFLIWLQYILRWHTIEPWAFRFVGVVAFVSYSVAIYSTITLIALRQRHQDVDNELWAKVWLSRIGRAAFRLGSKLLAPGERQTAVTHRATELSLGMAAEQLFDTLPREMRADLVEIPAVLKQLQADAQELRKRHEGIVDALAEAGDAATSIDYAEVREMRDTLQARLADAVGALETIRLNLLRLHAGTTTVEGVTTHLGFAAEVSEGVKALIAAHSEASELLKFPRTPTPTPV